MKTPSTDKIAKLLARIGKDFTELGLVFIGPDKPPSMAPSEAPLEKRSRGRPPKTAAEKSNGKKSFNDGVWTAVAAAGRSGITKANLLTMLAPGVRPNHAAIALKRHLDGGRIVERNGRYRLAPKSSSGKARQPDAQAAA